VPPKARAVCISIITQGRSRGHPDRRACEAAAARGGRRLADALDECDARGWDALPLAAKELARLFPNVWKTEKAAERWLAKNPQWLIEI
jgi:hypothetical protein